MPLQRNEQLPEWVHAEICRVLDSAARRVLAEEMKADRVATRRIERAERDCIDLHIALTEAVRRLKVLDGQYDDALPNLPRRRLALIKLLVGRSAKNGSSKYANYIDGSGSGHGGVDLVALRVLAAGDPPPPMDRVDHDGTHHAAQEAVERGRVFAQPGEQGFHYLARSSSARSWSRSHQPKSM